MPLTQAVIDNVANAAIDYHMDRGKLFYQQIQAKPLLDAMMKNKRFFPGGKGSITIRPVFETQSSIQGFDSDDTLTFTNPTPIKTLTYQWKMLHLGIYMTTDELLRDGISVVDTNGAQVSEHSQRDVTMLANILQAKLDDAAEGWAVGMNNILWKDGTQSAKEFPGIQYFITDDPTTGTVGGIDRATQPLWRNISLAGANAITPAPATQPITTALRKQVRQLTRYGTPRHLILCGSAFLDALEAEVAEKGIYTQGGWNKSINVGIGELSLNGLGTFKYDPTLDVLGKSKYCYFIDMSKFKLMPIEGEDFKKHYPARPHDKMVIYRSFTWAGGLVANQLNTSLVAAIA
ncbi:phage major capsid protein [Pseudomonas sp. PDM21]|uniref:phage major capsid protein n=1 Tax=Pseudomonas sp. PDM21 TaxID=2769257 RepID=UPI00177AF808|nr:phage major capsid protein [Pseudomonas sp. PDM21]MBD9674953.1 phage major capsid protein [Pseudomonas sp. PDM21]